MAQIGRINIWSFAKVGFFLFYVIGVALMIFVIVNASVTSVVPFSLTNALLMLLFGPVIYSLITTVPLLGVCWLYNWYAKRWGGVHVELFKETEQ